MATAQTEIESRILELASKALETFCKDISGTFGVEAECEQQEITTQTVAQLKKRFKKLVAVNIVDSEGILDGTFQLLLDQEGLFTVGGVMVMLPENRILANSKDASADLAESMVDAIGEAGNLLVGAWERIFREELEGHRHLVQRLPAFVGKPWDKPQDKIGLSPDEEHIFIPYEMKISPYPAFNGGVIFPKTIFEGEPASDSADAAPAEADTTQETEQSAAQETPATETADDEAAAEPAPGDEAPVEQGEAADKGQQAESPEAVEEKADSPQSDETEEGAVEESEQEPEAPAEQVDSVPEVSAAEEPAEEQPETPEKTKESATGPVSGAIKELAQLRVNGTSELLWLSAKDIMQPKVVWAVPDESLQQALIKLQQNDIGYLVVGSDEVLEGIISKADVAGAMSPYLRPMFAKWRKPSDDATLKIKLKWIMSRPVRTAGLDTPLASLLENMCRFGGRALPVVDEQGKVHGLVTAFDIFQMLLSLGADVPTAGKAAQGPPL